MKKLIPILSTAPDNEMIYIDKCSVENGIYVNSNNLYEGFVIKTECRHDRFKIVYSNGEFGSTYESLNSLLLDYFNAKFYDLSTKKQITLKPPVTDFLLRTDIEDKAQVISVKKSDGKIGVINWNKEYSMIHSDFDFYLITE